MKTPPPSVAARAVLRFCPAAAGARFRRQSGVDEGRANRRAALGFLVFPSPAAPAYRHP
jgi:hypothetical protein